MVAVPTGASRFRLSTGARITPPCQSGASLEASRGVRPGKFAFHW